MQNMAIIYNFCLHSGKKIVLIRTIIVIRCAKMMYRIYATEKLSVPFNCVYMKITLTLKTN